MAVAALEKAGFEVEFQRPRSPGDIPKMILDGAKTADRIVLGGGDGTFSRSASALIAAGRPVGVLPLGTANDLARTLGIPFDLKRAAAIAAGRATMRIDLGTINDRPFFNVASMGFSARVARHHESGRKQKWKLLSYPMSWLDAHRDTEPFRVQLSWGEHRRTFKSTLMAVGNGVHYGGGLTIQEDAAIDDGWLDVYYIRPLGPLGMLKLLPFLKFGALRRREDVKTLRLRSLHLETDPVQDINVDGEVIETTPARFGILPRALEVLVPDTR
ncbi:MAG: lipid kinase [Minwuia sp.]|uniref:lipid kinase n=1 Tax=Minwuia sp. TaxID=2493630 RepID=UPI003A892AF4